MIRFVNGEDFFCILSSSGKTPWLINKFTKYVSGSMYVPIHDYKIGADISTFPGVESFNIITTVMISFLEISGI